MKYRPSPLNIGCAIAAAFFIYFLIETGGDEILVAVSIFYFVILGIILLFDLLLQVLVSNKFTLMWIELGIMAVFGLIFWM